VDSFEPFFFRYKFTKAVVDFAVCFTHTAFFFASLKGNFQLKLLPKFQNNYSHLRDPFLVLLEMTNRTGKSAELV
jgi:hypothetical protein